MRDNLPWLLRARTGAELLATVKTLNAEPGLFAQLGEIGAPHSALDGPCRRCWIYPHIIEPSPRSYCPFCQAVIDRSRTLTNASHSSIVAWVSASELPRHLIGRAGVYTRTFFHASILDDRHFLLILPKRDLKLWLQETILYDADLCGLIQIIPTVGLAGPHSMGDMLSRLMYYESGFPTDQMWVKFYAAPYQVFKPREREREGLLTFDIADFLSVLEQATVFRSLLLPEAQKLLYELLNLEDDTEEQFYWGRMLTYLSAEAKDMLNAWRIRQWPRGRLRLLYTLLEYVEFYPIAQP
jgi:hypothetical protein